MLQRGMIFLMMIKSYSLQQKPQSAIKPNSKTSPPRTVQSSSNRQSPARTVSNQKHKQSPREDSGWDEDSGWGGDDWGDIGSTNKTTVQSRQRDTGVKKSVKSASVQDTGSDNSKAGWDGGWGDDSGWGTMSSG